MIIPNHIAIIPDGNRRFAIEKNIDVSEGHKIGADVLENFVKYFYKKGTKHITIYVMSHDNFIKRSKKEIRSLLYLVYKYLEKLIKEGFLTKNKIRVNFIGFWKSIGHPKLIKLIKKAIKMTQNYRKRTLNLCFNYFTIFNKIQYMKEKKLPEVDLLIRTGNRKRISGFLTTKIRYAELYFSKKMFPSCNKRDFYRWILFFNNQKRTFGG